ncbi:MAG: DUF2240 family protein [Candidatus Ranarchaeia archaeon]|jgi:hypothetical protein
MSQSLEEIIERIIQETGFGKKEVLDGIEKIKQDFAGLITDEGAAHIFAKNSGVDMFTEALPPHKTRIQDLITGMNNVSITVKIQQISNITEFSRKTGDPGAVGRIMVSDELGDITNLVLWDKQTQLISDKQVSIGDIIKITTAYTRLSNRDRVEIHLGKRGKLELLQDASPDDFPETKVPTRSSFSQTKEISPINEITMNSSFITVEGAVKRIFPLRVFQRKDGTEGKVRNLILADTTGSIRVTFWNEQVDLTEKENLGPGDKIRVLQVNPRENTYFAQKSAESSGDGTTPSPPSKPPLELHSNRTTTLVKVAAAGSSAAGEEQPLLPSALQPVLFNVSVLGMVANAPKETSFQKRDGTPGSLLYFRITDPNQPAGQYGTPVKIWNKTPLALAELKMGDVILITQAETRLGQNDRLELHATDGSSFQTNPESIPLPPAAPATALVGDTPLVTIRTLPPQETGRIRASIDAFHPLNPVYNACPKCKRKLTLDKKTKKWTCSSCKKAQTPKPTLFLRVTVNDGYDETTASVFDDVASTLLETTARKIQNQIKKHPDTAPWEIPLLKKKKQEIQGEEFILTVRKQLNAKTNETQLIITAAQRIDPVEQARLILSQIESEL